MPSVHVLQASIMQTLCTLLCLARIDSTTDYANPSDARRSATCGRSGGSSSGSAAKSCSSSSSATAALSFSSPASACMQDESEHISAKCKAALIQRGE